MSRVETMEQKYYQINTKTPADWRVVHKLLMQDGTLDDNIPCRSCECIDDILHSKTRSTYLMTDEEAEILRNDSRIESVCLDSRYHPEVLPEKHPSILRFEKNVRNYRALRKYNGSSYEYSIPLDSPYLSELNRTGYQLLRCSTRNNPFSSNAFSVVNSDVDYLYDGLDVDVIVVDDGVWAGHPEFVSDDYDPPNYIRGNVLSRSGLCGVLDLVIDSPYYLDPDWFNADPTNRLRRRWDGTIVPIVAASRSWWASSSSRSASFPNFGSIDIGSYDRAKHLGDVASRYTRPTIASEHGTPCASLTYGKNYGWAFNANKWSVAIQLGSGDSFSEGLTDETLFNVHKIFHSYKPLNPKFGTRNPTVSTNSWSSTLSFSETELVGSSWNFRNSDATGTITSSSSSVPNFLKTKSGSLFKYYESPFYISSSTTYLSAAREMIDSGVIFITAAGNNGRYIASKNDQFFNNYYQTPSGNRYYVNRPGYPAQIGFSETDSEFRTIIVGAVDDEYVGAYSSTPESDSYYAANAVISQERLARNGEFSSSTSPGIDYSNKGTGCDIYAPAEGTLAASSRVSRSSRSPETWFENPTPVPATEKVYDRTFNGTSSACPVTAGLIACILQNNRSWSISDVKNYLKNNIEVASNFWNGPTPSSATDTAWLVPYSAMGSRIRVIYQKSITISTPNETFRPEYGLNTSSGANERFTISEASGNIHNIEILGIKKFSETPTSYELNVKTGYYKVGCKSRISTTDLQKINLRIDPTNSKRLQLTDSDGVDSWDDMEILVTNGQFIKSSTEIYYVFRGGTLASSTAYTPSSVSVPAYTPTGGTYTGTTTSLIQTTYGGYPVRGYLYYPTSSNVSSSLDVIVLYHPTIESAGVSPADSALNFLNITKNDIKIKDKLIFSVAYPQDMIPDWNSNPSLASTQFPGLNYSTFYFGDNIVYAEAALLWVKNNLNAYMSSNGISKTVNRIFTFGHSQGAYLVHRLNTVHTVNGVISNAPGPIDLLQVCSYSEANSDSVLTCSKIKTGIGSTSTNGSSYNSRSLKNYLSGTKSPTLFTQALDDTTGNSYGSPQVANMQNVVQVGLGTCTNCAAITFKYYASGGHPAFVTNTVLQRDIRNFVGSNILTPGSITGGGDLIVTGDITAGDDIIGLVSDERLKENIKPIENALNKLEKLDGFTYNFNEIGERLGFDPNKRHSGVSAQSVKDILPEASAPAPADNEYLTVKYDKLIPLLIESIKDLKDDIDDIKKNDTK